MKIYLLLLIFFFSFSFANYTWCGTKTISSVLDNDIHPFDVAHNSKSNYYLIVYLERTGSGSSFKNTIWGQFMSEIETVGDPFKINDDSGDKRFVTVSYATHDDTFLVVYSFQTPSISMDWDIVTIQLDGQTGSTIGPPRYLMATVYDEETPTVVYNPRTKKYIISIEVKASSQYIWIFNVPSSGMPDNNHYGIGGGSVTEPRNITRPDVAYNSDLGDFMMALEYDQLSNHDIVALHLKATGEPDFNNYADVANFTSDDGIDAHEREPAIAYNSLSHEFMVALEQMIHPVFSSKAWIAEIVLRKVQSITGKPFGNYQPLHTTQPSAGYVSIQFDQVERYTVVCETTNRDNSISDIDFISVDIEGNQVSKLTVPGKHKDNNPRFVESMVDYNWMMSWSSHPQNSATASDNTKKIRSEWKRDVVTPKRDDDEPPVKLYKIDSSTFKTKPEILELYKNPFARYNNPEKQEKQEVRELQARYNFPGTTAELNVAAVCTTHSPTMTQSSPTPNLQPLLWLFIVGIIVVVLMGVAAGFGWWYLKKRKAAQAGVSSPSVKYVSLNTNVDEEEAENQI